MKDARPNILLLLTDQQRVDTISALGSKFGVETPNIDALVREGVTFTDCHCTAPICSPSRSTLMTGRYPTEAGMPGNLYAPAPPLDPSNVGIGKLMRAAGYETAYHGKWHLGGSIQAHGFDTAEECSHDETTRQLASRFWRDRDWIEHERPFFHVVSFLDPHDLYFYDPSERVEGFQRPWQNLDRPADSYPATAASKRVDWPEERWGAYHQFYAERVAKVDRDIGILLDELRCSGFFSNTWIIFAADHGDMAGEQNIPFKGAFMYEGVTRVPLVIVPPRGRFLGDVSRKVKEVGLRGAQLNGQCSLIDIVPTILSLAGQPTEPEMSGTSLLPWIMGERADSAHEIVFAEWHNPRVFMARRRDWKYVRYEDGGEELFSLLDDSHESVNRSNEPTAASIKAELSAALDNHIAQLERNAVRLY
ncbi:sulfatase family protein [Cerasicoccus maritimus]|uniref:sulfatase family protein n=1 Tax=Cerasicoccus maritimus TaxID=490089 RepID=UPI0028528D07|nr:sulfatase-like hydrolase/transferase [Cerasicoccus maritimus]